MTGNAINAKSDALVRDLSSEELDAVSGGWFRCYFVAPKAVTSEQGQNDPAQMFQQIMQQLTQGG